MADREIPVDDESMVWRRPSPKRPFTPMEALMQCAPGDEPEESQLELLALRDVLADAIEGLTPRQRWVFNASVIEGKGVRRIAEDLGLAKSTVHLILKNTKAELRKRLADNEVIRERLRPGR